MPFSTGQRRWLIVFALFTLIGIVARCDRIGGSYFWFDEMVTVVHAAGRLAGDLEHKLDSGHPVDLKEVAAMEDIAHGAGVTAVLRSIAIEDPQHPPLYYVLVYEWTRLFGSSPVVLRAFSVLCGLLLLGGAWWFGLELGLPLVTRAAAVALVAVSPLEVLYSKQAREYSLCALVALAASAALLRALRQARRRDWILYVVLAITALYSSVFSILVLAGHLVYALTAPREERHRWGMPLAISAGVVTAAFVPWLAVLARSWSTASVGSSWSSGANMYGRGPLANLALLGRVVFADLLDPVQYLGHQKGGLWVYDQTLMFVFAGLCALSLFVLWRERHRAGARFLLCTGALPAILLAAADLYLKSSRAGVLRYHLAFVAPVLFGVAWLLHDGWPSPRARSAGATLCLLALSAGVLSHLRSRDRLYWWPCFRDTNEIERTAAWRVIRFGTSLRPPLIVFDKSLGYEAPYAALEITRMLQGRMPALFATGLDPKNLEGYEEVEPDQAKGIHVLRLVR